MSSRPPATAIFKAVSSHCANNADMRQLKSKECPTQGTTNYYYSYYNTKTDSLSDRLRLIRMRDHIMDKANCHTMDGNTHTAQSGKSVCAYIVLGLDISTAYKQQLHEINVVESYCMHQGSASCLPSPTSHQCHLHQSLFRVKIVFILYHCEPLFVLSSRAWRAMLLDDVGNDWLRPT